MIDKKSYEYQEQSIKSKIMEARQAGVCDRNGATIPTHQRGYMGKGDWSRVTDKERFDANYDLIDWSDNGTVQ